MNSSPPWRPTMSYSARSPGQHVGDGDEQGVAGLVAMGVVDGLERSRSIMATVKHCPQPPRLRRHAHQRVLDQSAVAEAGQRRSVAAWVRAMVRLRSVASTGVPGRSNRGSAPPAPP